MVELGGCLSTWSTVRPIKGYGPTGGRCWNYAPPSRILSSFRLSDYCPVFQAEIDGKLMACKKIIILSDMSFIKEGVKIMICVDSQAALMSLEETSL